MMSSDSHRAHTGVERVACRLTARGCACGWTMGACSGLALNGLRSIACRMLVPRRSARDCDPLARLNSIHRREHPQPVVSRQQAPVACLALGLRILSNL